MTDPPPTATADDLSLGTNIAMPVEALNIPSSPTNLQPQTPNDEGFEQNNPGDSVNNLLKKAMDILGSVDFDCNESSTDPNQNERNITNMDPNDILHQVDSIQQDRNNIADLRFDSDEDIECNPRQTTNNSLSSDSMEILSLREDEQDVNENPRERRNNGNIEGSIEDSGCKLLELQHYSYLGAFLAYLHTIGMSSVSWGGKYMCCHPSIYKFLFFFCSLLGILQALQVVKVNVMINWHHVEVLLFYVDLGYLINVLVLRLYYQWVIYFKANDIIQLLNTLKNSNGLSVLKEGKVAAVTIICLLSSILLGIGETCLEFAKFWGAEPKEMILYASRDLSYALYWWDITDVTNMTHYLTVNYGDKITFQTFLMGAINYFVTILGHIQGNVIKDISIISALTLNSMTTEFLSHLNAENGEDKQIIWEKFKILRKFSNDLDNCFGMLFLFISFDNLLSSAYFLFNQVVRDEDEMYTTTSLIISIIYFLKYLSFYIIAAFASTVNSKFKSWILLNFHGSLTTFIEKSHPVATINICEEVTTNPIGIGKGIFFIDITFIWKFSSVVGSLFVFFNNPRIEPASSQFSV